MDSLLKWDIRIKANLLRCQLNNRGWSRFETYEILGWNNNNQDFDNCYPKEDYKMCEDFSSEDDWSDEEEELPIVKCLM